ncbi:30S ribosome-binding factor RbfA [Arcanobacterium phocae]|uniref:Ribosome-binding factor A n=1 Tax=Arcanobacterium phocae TaxID=131112 RepID=A0A1H2LLW8_9ACTO|nr:30S ribosome-binding factor RbfA [Arcanobacterium phocae]SDU81993.1 ribosome-binding factor A [Arcanobacterium phocae]
MVNPRAARVAERIQQVVASMLDKQIKDPRLGMVTITDVRVTGDLQHADVFYTVFGDEHDAKSTAAALRSATGVIRSNVGKQLGLRLTPSLAFHLDALPESAKSIEDLLIAARYRDEQIRKMAQDAQYAGDPDPYRKPDEESAESVDLLDSVADDELTDSTELAE